MPSYVITEKCDGCKGQERTACMYICPNDLMKLDRDRMKAWNQEPDQCWECYNCVKICPQQAISQGVSGFQSPWWKCYSSQGYRRYYVDGQVQKRYTEEV